MYKNSDKTRTETAIYCMTVSGDKNNNVSFQTFNNKEVYKKATSNWQVMKNGKVNKVFGIIVIGISILLLLRSFYLLYCYNFTNILFLFMYPNWILFINAVLGAVGIYISILLYKEKIRFILFLFLILLIWILTFVSYAFPESIFSKI